MTEPSPVESQRFLVKILHFDLSHKTETGYPPGLQDHFFFFFCLLLILRFLVGYPARPAGSLGEMPGCSSYSVFLLGRPHRLFLWVGPGFPSG